MTPHRRPHSSARRSLLAAAALVAFAIACNAPVPTSPHPVYSLSVPVRDARAGLPIPGDTVVYHIDGAIASESPAESLRVDDVPLTMLLEARTANEIRKQAELWITTDKVKQDARLDGIGARPTGANDRAEALREKIQLDAAAAATTVHMKRPMTFTGRIVIDGRPATMSTFKRLPPELIQSVDVMKHADSNGVLAVVTTDH